MVLQVLILPCATFVLVGRRMPAAHTVRMGQLLMKRNSCLPDADRIPKMPGSCTDSGNVQSDGAERLSSRLNAVFCIRAKRFPMNTKLVRIETTPTEGQL